MLVITCFFTSTIDNFWRQNTKDPSLKYDIKIHLFFPFLFHFLKKIYYFIWKMAISELFRSQLMFVRAIYKILEQKTTFLLTIKRSQSNLMNSTSKLKRKVRYKYYKFYRGSFHNIRWTWFITYFFIFNYSFPTIYCNN